MFFTKKFFKKSEGERIVQSIMAAEARTSGEIRVHIQKKIKGELMEEAIKVFKHLKMDETELRNSVLIFIVPSKKSFCIIGDEGIDNIVPENFWEDIKEDLRMHFQSNKITEGLCKNIERIGEKLKSHFPIEEDDKNELPDTISYA